MKVLIENALKETGLDYFYLKRAREKFPCIVYQYHEYPNALGDNTEESTSYERYFNLIIKKDLTTTTNLVKQILKKHGFGKVVINAPIMFEDTDYYQITMQYVKSKAI